MFKVLKRKHEFNKKIKFYRELINNINLLISDKETKYKVLNNTYYLINALGVNESLSIRQLGKQLDLMIYCEGQINLYYDKKDKIKE